MLNPDLNRQNVYNNRSKVQHWVSMNKADDKVVVFFTALFYKSFVFSTVADNLCVYYLTDK